MTKALYLRAIPAPLSPLAPAAAEPANWYLGGLGVCTDDGPARRLDEVVGSAQIHVGRHVADVFTLEAQMG